MKKMLSILATVGLVATTGTTVIACANGKEEGVAKGAFDLEGDHNLLTGQWTVIRIPNYNKIKAKYSKFEIKNDGRDGIIRTLEFDKKTGFFLIGGAQKGEALLKIEATVKPKPGSTDPEVKETSSVFKVTVDVADFSDAEIEVHLVPGQKLDEAKEAIRKAIHEQFVEWTVIDRDWTVSGDAIDEEGEVLKEGTLIVTAVENNIYVKGSFEIKVEKEEE